MREQFLAFQLKTPADYEKLWSDADFSFDANVLLDTYELSSESREVFLDQLGLLGTRTFITHQAGLEFYRNRPRVIATARKNLEVIANALDEIPAAFSETARQSFTALLKEEATKIGSFLTDDPIEKALDGLFGDRVGAPLSDLQSKYALIDQRYAKEIPPGFADCDEKEDYKRYGDAVLWMELIEHARQSERPLILVTSETKHDWWAKDKQQKILGPRPELAQGMWNESQVLFHLYSFSEFLKHAQVRNKAKNANATSAAVQEVQLLEEKKEKEEALGLSNVQQAEFLRSVESDADLRLSTGEVKLNQEVEQMEKVKRARRPPIDPKASSWANVMEETYAKSLQSQLAEAEKQSFLIRKQMDTYLGYEKIVSDQLRKMKESKALDRLRILEESSALNQLRKLEESSALNQLRKLEESSALNQLRKLEESSALNQLRKLQDSSALNQLRSLEDSSALNYLRKMKAAGAAKTERRDRSSDEQTSDVAKANDAANDDPQEGTRGANAAKKQGDPPPK